MVQWLRICLPMQGTRVQSLAGKLRSHVLQGNQACVLQLESLCTATTEPVCHSEDEAQPPKKKASKPLVSSKVLCQYTGDCHIPKLRKKGAKKKWRPQYRPTGWRRQKDNHRCRKHQGCSKAKGKVKQRRESTWKYLRFFNSL